jgi:hypothetical protein
VLSNPTGNLPLSGMHATKNEIRYARWTDQISHVVVSTTLKEVKWKTTRIIRDVEEIREMKQRPGKDIDEVRLLINPVALGRSKTLFNDVNKQHTMKSCDSGVPDG